MPLPIPLIFAAVVLSSGVLLHAIRPNEDEDEESISPHDPLPYQIAYTRRRMAGRLRHLGSVKLNTWQHELRWFVSLQRKLTGLHGKEPELFFESRPPLDKVAQDRIIACAALIRKQDDADNPDGGDPIEYTEDDIDWEDRLDNIDLADFAARGVSPLSPKAQDGISDCLTLDWLMADEPPATDQDVHLFGGLRLDPMAQKVIRDPNIQGASHQQLRALLKVMEDFDAVVQELSDSLGTVRERARSALGEMTTALHNNTNYDEIPDAPLPGEVISPKDLVALNYHYAAVLMDIMEQPLLQPDGRMRVQVADMLDLTALVLLQPGWKRLP